MKLDDFTSTFPKLPGAMPVWHGIVNAKDLHELCEQVLKSGGKLVALWGEDRIKEYALHAALVTASGMLVLTLPVNHNKPDFPDLSDLFPAANRMQRAVADMFGLHPLGAGDRRKWLRHASWPEDMHPLRKSFDIAASFPLLEDGYHFVSVTGNGVHEIAVGPVHAGTIEPGHFRFSVIGERVLRLEERLGFAHKGIEQRFTQLPILDAHRLAARVSGDSAVAFAWAYCQALEGMAGE